MSDESKELKIKELEELVFDIIEPELGDLESRVDDFSEFAVNSIEEFKYNIEDAVRQVRREQDSLIDSMKDFYYKIEELKDLIKSISPKKPTPENQQD